MNIQWSKQPCFTWSCLVETCFFSVFFLLTKFFHGRKWSIFSKAPNWKTLFLPKIKQNPGSPNKGCNVIFKPFHQNIKVYSRNKTKSALINWENVAYWKESKQNKALANNFNLSQIHLGWSGGVAMPGKFSIFPLSWKHISST